MFGIYWWWFVWAMLPTLFYMQFLFFKGEGHGLRKRVDRNSKNITAS
jgi:hypothetical protein